MLLSALKSLNASDMNIIKLKDFHLVESLIGDIYTKNSEWFPDGFKGIYAVNNDEFFAAVDQGAFYFSDSDTLVKGFKPASLLISAIQSQKEGNKLSFNQEYAVETLWHEMTHGITGIISTKNIIGEEPLYEGIVQMIARSTYPELMGVLGMAPLHQSEILSGGLSYPVVTRNLLYLMEVAGISVDDFRVILRENPSHWLEAFKEKLSVGINTKRIGSLLNAATHSSLDEFKAKIAVQQKNAPLFRKEQ